MTIVIERVLLWQMVVQKGIRGKRKGYPSTDNLFFVLVPLTELLSIAGDRSSLSLESFSAQQSTLVTPARPPSRFSCFGFCQMMTGCIIGVFFFYYGSFVYDVWLGIFVLAYHIHQEGLGGHKGWVKNTRQPMYLLAN